VVGGKDEGGYVNDRGRWEDCRMMVAVLIERENIRYFFFCVCLNSCDLTRITLILWVYRLFLLILAWRPNAVVNDPHQCHHHGKN